MRAWLKDKRLIIGLENDGAATLQEDAALGEVADCAGENAAFGVTACCTHFLRCVGMRDTYGFLLDNWAFVEVGCGEMRGCADDFYAALIGLFVGVCAFKTREE